MPANLIYKKSKILHITPHLGGGVGRVLLNYFAHTKESKSFVHQVACLDYANKEAIETAKNIGLKLFDKMSSKKNFLLKMIAEADIALVHWWNHPLLYDFLVRTSLPSCRLIMWSHNSGFNAPYVFTKKILAYPDIFVFTTPISFETKEIQILSNKKKQSLRVVWSTAGVDHVKSVRPKAHKGFNIGYIGTVDYVKLHPNFLNICNKINIPDVKFIVCGGSNEQEIKKEAEAMGIADKFIFTGLISNVTEYLSIFDIFGYPLASHHYGTCDQVLAESMAAGVVPVALPNRMEKYMIKDGVSGIVAKNENGYINAIQKLYANKALRKLLSKNAREYAIKTFSVNKMAKEWEVIFKEALTMPKTNKKWNILKDDNNITAKDVFLESLGSYNKVFANYCSAKTELEKINTTKKIINLNKSALWQASSKGTVHQYYSFFSNDKHLAIWSRLTKNDN